MRRRLLALLALPMLILLSACGPGRTPSATATPSPGPKTGPVQEGMIIWERSGGIAGICQRLTIQPGGGYRLEDCLRVSPVRDGTLPKEKLERLTQWLDQCGAFEWNPPQPPGADQFMDRYTFGGRGRRSPSDAERAEINDYLAQLTADLLTQ